MVIEGGALLLVFLVAWAAWAEVDEVTRGGEGDLLQEDANHPASEPGVVQEILVRLGQQVKQGDILVRLDNTMTDVQPRRSRGQGAQPARAGSARLLIERDGKAEQGYVCPADIEAVAPGGLQQRGEPARDPLRGPERKSRLHERIEQRQRELNEAEQNATRIAESLELAQRELDMINPLAARNIAPKTEQLRAQRAVVELRGQQAANRRRRARVAAALREAATPSRKRPCSSGRTRWRS